MKAAFSFGIAAALTAAGFAGAADAQLYQRYVVVNGQRLTMPQIVQLERMYCGPIANGAYWFDPDSGVWGYAGDPTPMGRIGDNCRRGARRPSLSERGLLYTPGDPDFR